MKILFPPNIKTPAFFKTPNKFSFWFRFLAVILLIGLIYSVAVGYKCDRQQSTKCVQDEPTMKDEEQTTPKVEKLESEYLNKLTQWEFEKISPITTDEPQEYISSIFVPNQINFAVPYTKIKDNATYVTDNFRISEEGHFLDSMKVEIYDLYIDKYIYTKDLEDANVIIDDGSRGVDLYTYLEVDNKRYIASDIILFDRFTPEKCYLYSFIEQSNVLFLVCAINENREQGISNYFVLGLYRHKNLYNEYDGEFTSFYYQEFEAPYAEVLYDARTNFLIANTKRDEFIIIVNNEAHLVKPSEGMVGEKTQLTPYFPKEHGPLTTPVYNITVNNDGSYIMYRYDQAGGILDVKNWKPLEIDESCFAETQRIQETEETGYSRFYNDTVDIFTEGPYKVPYITSWVGRNLVGRQRFCSGGSCAFEGTINMYMGDEKVDCRINVEYEELPCE